jgi:hypothetical protein
MVRAQTTWGDVDNVPVFAANQFLLQLSATDPELIKSDLLLTVGFASPPVLFGTPEELQEAAASVERVTVRPVARFSIPLGKAAELSQVLQEFVQQVQQAARQQP